MYTKKEIRQIAIDHRRIKGEYALAKLQAINEIKRFLEIERKPYTAAELSRMCGLPVANIAAILCTDLYCGIKHRTTERTRKFVELDECGQPDMCKVYISTEKCYEYYV